MLGEIAKYIENVSTLRRLLFAIKFLPVDYPHYWDTVIEFATCGQTKKDGVVITASQAKVLSDNLQAFDCRAFDTNATLFNELILFNTSSNRPLGVVLISENALYLVCGSKLVLRKD